VIKQSALNLELKGEPAKSTVLITLEVDNLQESVGRPWDRKPPVNQGVINKLIQAALSARGGHRQELQDPDSQPGDGAGDEAKDGGTHSRLVAPCDQDLLIITDGGRDHLKNVLQGAWLG
jgi:hypothetical protein